jgi:hypothetical protein
MTIYYCFDPAKDTPPKSHPKAKFTFGFVYTFGRRNRLFHSKKENYADAFNEFQVMATEWKRKIEARVVATYKIVDGEHVLIDSKNLEV